MSKKEFGVKPETLSIKHESKSMISWTRVKKVAILLEISRSWVSLSRERNQMEKKKCNPAKSHAPCGNRASLQNDAFPALQLYYSSFIAKSLPRRRTVGKNSQTSGFLLKKNCNFFLMQA